MHLPFLIFLDLFLLLLSWVRAGPLHTSATISSTVPAVDDYGAVSGMKAGKANLTTQRKPFSVPLSPQ
jgi:hypothetical protein